MSKVKAGDLLFRIDPEPYQLQIAEAKAAIASAQANVTALANSADLSGADIAAAREDIAFAKSRFERQRELMKRGFTTKADYDAAEHAVAQARRRAAPGRRPGRLKPARSWHRAARYRARTRKSP